MTAEGRPWFQRLRESLTRTRDQLAVRLEALAGRAIDDAYLAELEEALILADVGAATAAEVTSRLRAARGLHTTADVQAALRRILLDLIGPAVPFQVEPPPAVVLALGVNGSGKTTTIAKLAYRLRGEGRKVLLAAADTFRAAAIDQLAIWAQRAGVEMVRHQPGPVVSRGHRCHRHRFDETGRHGQGRHCPGHRPRLEAPGEISRDGGAAGRPHAVRPRGLRRCSPPAIAGTGISLRVAPAAGLGAFLKQPSLPGTILAAAATASLIATASGMIS